MSPPPQRAPAAAAGRTRPEPRSAVLEHPRLRLCFPPRLPQPDFNAFSTRCRYSLGVFIFFLAVRGVQPRALRPPSPQAASGLASGSGRGKGGTWPWGGAGVPVPQPRPWLRGSRLAGRGGPGPAGGSSPGCQIRAENSRPSPGFYAGSQAWLRVLVPAGKPGRGRPVRLRAVGPGFQPQHGEPQQD